MDFGCFIQHCSQTNAISEIRESNIERPHCETTTRQPTQCVLGGGGEREEEGGLIDRGQRVGSTENLEQK